MSLKLRVGTRKSELARTQTKFVIQKLKEVGFEAEEHLITTTGDVDSRPFTEISGDGFFTKEIERQLLNNKIDLAVHSSKDLPSMVLRNLPWFAMGDREEACDILISKPEFQELKSRTRVGTSSPRRRAQLKKHFPNVEAVEFRGNVTTRIEKVIDGTVDAIILAKAGLNRLKLQDYVKSKGLIVKDLNFTTAPCQGILALQGRFEHLHVLEKVINPELTVIAKAEKSLLSLFGGGCHLALGTSIRKSKEGYDFDFFLEDNNISSEFKIHSARLGDVIRSAFLKTLNVNNSLKQRVWLTQPLQHQLHVAKKMLQANLMPVVWPLTEVQSVCDPKSLENLDLSEFEGVCFSSQFGVQIFLMEWASTQKNFEQLKKTKKFAVGETTANALIELGLKVTIPEKFSAGNLSAILPKSKKAYLLPGTPATRLAQYLTKTKQPYKILPLYESVRSKSALRLDVPEVLPDDKIVLTSPSAVEEFVVECKNHKALEALKVFAMGPSTSKALEKHGVKHTPPEASGLWDTLIQLLGT